MQTYQVVGTDGKEYGPISKDVLRQWIAQRRVVATTSTQVVGGGEWRPLASYPEFTEALAAVQAPPVAGQIGSVLPPPAGPSKTSRLAIAALVCGLLGFLVLPALAGLLLGVMALIKISKSQGVLRGQGLAIVGIVLSASC